MAAPFNVSGQTLAQSGPPSYTGKGLRTSAMGLPIPIFWGTRRLTPNLIWWSTRVAGWSGPNYFPGDRFHGQVIGRFGSTVDGVGTGVFLDGAYPASQQDAGNIWWVPAILALCEGPINSVGKIWDGTGASPVADPTALELKYDVLTGQATQAVWIFWTIGYPPDVAAGLPTPRTYGDLYPGQDLAYRRTAYIASQFVKCSGGDNDTPQIPSYSFECVRTPNSAYAHNGDYSLADIIPDFLKNIDYGMGMLSSDIDAVSLLFFKTYQFAQTLYFSPLLNGQDKATDILNRWAVLGNTWIFWDGTIIRFVPLGDIALTANGQTYTPDLTPAYALTVDDFLDGGKPVTVSRKDPTDCFNHLTLQISDRSIDYAASPIEYKDQGLIDQYGVRDASSIQGDDCCSNNVAQACANLIGKRLSYIRNTYAFTLPYRYIRVLPGTILSLTEPNLGLAGTLVRVQSVDEDEAGHLAIVAEEVPGTAGIATPQGSQAGSGGNVNVNVSPGNVNTPAIIEPNSALSGSTPEVLLAASGGNDWGGCLVYFSTDNTNYTQIGTISPGAPQGLLTATLASHADPDTANTLAVDCTESVALLQPVTHADADAARTLSVIEAQPTGTNPLVMPTAWELLSYGTVAPTPPYSDSLTYLRRGQFGSTIASHASGQQFTRIDPTGLTGSTLRWPLQAQYVGVTLYFKFPSFNRYGLAQQQLAGVPAYQYTPTGVGFGGGTAGVPHTPTGLTALGGAGVISVSWNPNPSTDNVTSYTLFRAPGLGAVFGSATAIWTGAATGYNDVGLGNGVSFTYFVEANNSVGASPPTVGVGATTLSTGVGGLVTGVDVAADVGTPDNAHIYVGRISGFNNVTGLIPIKATAVETSNGTAVFHRQGQYVLAGITFSAIWLSDFAASPTNSNWTIQTDPNANTGTTAIQGPGTNGAVVVTANGSGNIILSTSGSGEVAALYSDGSNFIAGAVTGGSNKIVLESGSFSSSRRFTALNQVSTGVASANIPTGDGVTWVGNRQVVPSSAPTGGALLYAENGELWVYQAATGSGTQHFHIQPGGSSVAWTLDLNGSNNSQQWVTAIGSSGSPIAAGLLPLHITTLQFDKDQAAPTWSQAAATTDVQANGLFWAPQQAYSAATGTHRQSGSAVVFLGTPTNGGVAEAALEVTRTGTPLWYLQAMPGTPTTSALYTGVGTPTVANYIIAQDSGGGNLQINDGGAGAISFNFTGTQYVVFDSAVPSVGIGFPIGGINGIPLRPLESPTISVTGGTRDIRSIGTGEAQYMLLHFSGTLTSDQVIQFPIKGLWIVDAFGVVLNGHNFIMQMVTGQFFNPGMYWITGEGGGTLVSMVWT